MIISEKKQKVVSVNDVGMVVMSLLNAEDEHDRDKEHFWVIGMNVRGIIQYIDLVSLGTLTGSVVHPRETFRLAVMKCVDRIILAHNHPSGDVSPSLADRQVTERMVHSGDTLGIKVIDHVIVANDLFYSFHQEGLI